VRNVPDIEPSSPALPETGVVLVPRRPGPLLLPDPPSTARDRDEIDDVVDELFGPDPGGAAGPMDAVLLLGGLGLLAWSELLLRSTGWTVVAVCMIVLGSILPIRSLWRRAEAWRAGRRGRAGSAHGVALSLDDPLQRDLVVAYRELLQVAEHPSAPFRPDALSAAHLALIEAATLVDTSGPPSAADVEYVERRVAAIRDLAAELRRHCQSIDDGRRDEQREERSLQRTARALAREELDAAGMSSLRELEELRRALARDDGD
jgi:hypothetical protein